MHRLPPLTALRAFEAAARTGSFALAGKELGVTAAAVSQQVRQLEGWLGKTLFFRSGNRIMLSDAGRAAYPQIERAFSDLAAVSAALGERRPRSRIVLSVMPVLSERWLMPALAAWREGEGRETALEIRVETDPVAFVEARVDLRITYGASLYPDHLSVPLWQDRAIAVCSAAFASRWLTTPDNLSHLPDAAFIHTHWGSESATETTWANYMTAVGIARLPDPSQGIHLDLTGLAIAAAEAGLGLALAPEALIADALASGNLVRALPHDLPLAQPYCLILPRAAAGRSDVRSLTDHLLEVGDRTARRSGEMPVAR